MITNDKNIKQGGVFANQRIVGLDLFRVTLALLIFAFHSHIHFECHYMVLDDFVSVGAIAMTGFFLLSGYSLRLVYGKNNLMDKKELRQFYTKRILNIIPLYYTLAIGYMLFLGEETWIDNLFLFPIEALGLQSTFCSLFGVTHNGGTWFISCLLLGYLMYPFLQTVIKQLSTKQKVILLILLIFVDLWASFVRCKFHTAWIYDNPFYRMLEFSIGLIIADVNISEDGKIMKFLRSWWILIVALVTLIISVSLVNHIFNVSDYMLLNWIVLPCFIFMLFPLGSLQMTHLGKSKVLNYASKISYAFFLAQYFAWKGGRWFVETIGYNHNWVRILFTFTLCVLISILMYEIVQKRLVGLIKNRYIL